jgi:hypothetical protein
MSLHFKFDLKLSVLSSGLGQGIMEHWINGFDELTEWVIGKITSARDETNEKFGSNPFGRRQIYIIPKLHHSIIPYVEVKSLNLNKYNYFQ